jgi:CelD/BcsL family acetyltransferase involved in cellulose biosynthesis
MTKAAGYLQIQEKWQALVQASGRCTVFQYPEWQGNIDAVERDPWIIHGEGFVASVYLSLRNSTRTVRLPEADYCDIVAEPGREAEAFSRILDELQERKGWDICDFRSLLPESALLEGYRQWAAQPYSPAALKVRVQVLPHQEYAIVRPPATWKEYEGVLGKKRAYELRAEAGRRQRYFGQDGLRCADAGTFDEDFAAYIRLHQTRWNAVGQEGQFADPAAAERLRRFCETMLDRGQLRLYTVRFGDAPGGAMLNFADDRRIYFYGCGFDPEFKKHQPVKVLIARAIQDSIDHGPRLFDFLKGNEAYKDIWANGVQGTSRLVISRGTARSRLAAAALVFQYRYQQKRREARHARRSGEQQAP